MTRRTAITGRIKVDKGEADGRVDELNAKPGVEAGVATTDEFDVPPTAVLDITVDLEEL